MRILIACEYSGKTREAFAKLGHEVLSCDMGLINRTGPCVKQTVTATIVSKSGKNYTGTNYCNNPQTICPRADMLTGIGYELCSSICQQSGHAEINAIKSAGDESIGAILYLEGHSYVCASCTKACKDAGIEKIIISSPPSSNI